MTLGNSTFKGGAHPYEGKELSMDEPIRVMEPKTEMVFPMSQHIGAPATPTVAVGDTVKMGQIIGEASGFISANIVSSVSGTVKKIEPRLTGSGAKATCVIIENDGEDTAVEGLGEERDYTKLSKEEIRQIFRNLYNLYIDIGKKKYDNIDMKYLSMGMSNDFEIAVEEGANIVRIGRALFKR